MSAEFYLQSAMYSILDAALSVPVFSNVPDNQQGAYVVIGDMSTSEWDTDARTGRQITATVDVWEQATSMESVRQIMGQVSEALDRASIAQSVDFSCIGIDFTDSTLVRDPDGVTLHGTVNFNAYIRSI